MKQLNQLLKYREYYVYLSDSETIWFAAGEEKEAAIDAYSSAIRNCILRGDDKWALDIALDCIRNFTDDEIKHVEKNKEIFDYHLGYGMYVRNKYVHPSRFHVYLMADKISSIVYKLLIGIICEDVNPFTESE